MLYPGHPMSPARMLAVKAVCYPGVDLDGHRVLDRYEDDEGVLTFILDGGWTFRMDKGATMERSGDAVHRKGCKRSRVETATTLTGYDFCRDCSRFVWRGEEAAEPPERPVGGFVGFGPPPAPRRVRKPKRRAR